LQTRPTVAAGAGTLTELRVTTLVEGDGPATAAGQTIAVQYVGASYTTGEEFDASWSRGQPFSFALGQGQVIQGWDQGLVGVKVGSRVQLDIPSAMAYGDESTGGAPTGPLRFVVDVLSAS
ncbi:MAG: peptidylprolyl isomerase, partial [Dactylosporangium sp.]|nr:FKBP-type peptidyl-prolyl cis-trans isomerase [Dactylosporangium sp.]NNJ61263.1 peptidylprolyl isomerase [Dactylosporangium sp.]